MDATVLGQYKASLHLPHAIPDLKMEKERKKKSVKGGIEPNGVQSMVVLYNITL